LRTRDVAGDDERVLWRRLEPALTEDVVDELFHALWRIHGLSVDILRILREEFDGEAEADEP
jgi:hypothetical protein